MAEQQSFPPLNWPVLLDQLAKRDAAPLTAPEFKVAVELLRGHNDMAWINTNMYYSYLNRLVTVFLRSVPDEPDEPPPPDIVHEAIT